MGDIISLLQYFGITPDRIVPLALVVGIILWQGFRFISPIKKSITRITNACIEIQTIIESGGVPLKHHLVESPGSPLRPTDYGKKLIVDSGLEKILDDQKVVLKEKLQTKLGANKTEYDVQEKARGLLLELKESEMMNPVKKYAYENGINADIIFKVGGLWLRDDYLGISRGVNKEA